MKMYMVVIQAECQCGQKLEFTEVLKMHGISEETSVPEWIREGDAVQQVRERMPNLRYVRAKSSIHIRY